MHIFNILLRQYYLILWILWQAKYWTVPRKDGTDVLEMQLQNDLILSFNHALYAKNERPETN